MILAASAVTAIDSASGPAPDQQARVASGALQRDAGRGRGRRRRSRCSRTPSRSRTPPSPRANAADPRDAVVELGADHVLDALHLLGALAEGVGVDDELLRGVLEGALVLQVDERPR